ncbi:MAG: 23S rRNA (pseudouridine(1915)-N(3))-methyltransferase RlmH [Acidobacteria bacterium]|nr:23S rRNA (pseudouridine(1915)-N(3))-methyltransferase RlmH [Acidobacteriota bacterium]
MKLHFVWIGKTRDQHCDALVNDYLVRLKRFTQFEVSELKEQSREDALQVIALEGGRLLGAVEKDEVVVLLDERGTEKTSTELAEFIRVQQQSGIKRLAFIIGGFAGVSSDVKARATVRLSLSKMTLTHELARVILTEQVYRAFTILAGLPYHKF